MRRSVITAFCVILLLSMPFILCGCQHGEYLLGTWEGEMDYTDLLDSAVAESGDMAEYMNAGSFVLTVRLTFRKDGVYTVEVDEQNAKEAFQKVRERFIEGFYSYLESMIQEQGLELTPEQLLAIMEVSPDELLEEYFGEAAVQAMVESVRTEGNYKAQNGRLYTSESTQVAIDESRYETYVVTSDELRILAPVGQDVNEADGLSGIYPMVFRKAS